MTKAFAAIAAIALMVGLIGPVRADDTADCKAIVDKAVKALGGDDALSKIKAVSWKSKTTLTFNNTENEGASEVFLQGLDHYRQEFSGEFNGNKFKAVTIVSGDKGARKFGDMRMDLDADALAEQKRAAYLTAIPVTILALREKDFKLAPIADEKIADKPAAGLNVTGPDKKEFKIYFDKESGLPVREVATVKGFGNQGDFLQTMEFTEYKDMAGIKKATKLVAKRDGNPFLTQTITEFKVLDKVDPKVFTEVE